MFTTASLNGPHDDVLFARRLLVHLSMAAVALLLVGCRDHSTPAKPANLGEQQAGVTEVEQPSAARNARLPRDLPREHSERPPRDTDWFISMAKDAGLEFAYRDGNEAGFYQLIESVGGGVACFDYDNDGDIDLLFIGGGQLSGPPIQLAGRPLGLFRNDAGRFTEVTDQARLSCPEFYSHGCTVGDFDNDGFADLFVAGFHGCLLFHNQQDGTFADVTSAAGLALDRWGTAAAWGDVNNDGTLDLYQVTYADWRPDHTRSCPNDQGLRDVCGPTLFPGARDVLWLNASDGTFRDVTAEAGLVEQNRGLGVVMLDFDEDGEIDIFVANDVHANQLYIGSPGVAFDQQGEIAGVAYSASGEREGSMGLDAGDFNGDGLPDLWYANYANQDNSLLQKTAGSGFINVSGVTGILGRSRPWVGFGTALVDWDGDGWLDLFVANGHVAYDRLDGPYFQPAQLFRNELGKRYVEVSALAAPYFSVPHAGRGAAPADLDDDGDPDLIIVHQNDPVAVLQNQRSAGPWVRLRMHAVNSNRDAVGAKISLERDGRTLTQWIRGGGGYLSYFDPRVLFALSDDLPVDVSVQWPDGTQEVFTQLTTGQTHELVEGMGRPAG